MRLTPILLLLSLGNVADTEMPERLPFMRMKLPLDIDNLMRRKKPIQFLDRVFQQLQCFVGFLRLSRSDLFQQPALAPGDQPERREKGSQGNDADGRALGGQQSYPGDHGPDNDDDGVLVASTALLL